MCAGVQNSLYHCSCTRKLTPPVADWLEQCFREGPHHLIFFPFSEPGLCRKTRFLSEHTQCRELANREEIFTELTKRLLDYNQLQSI